MSREPGKHSPEIPRDVCAKPVFKLRSGGATGTRARRVIQWHSGRSIAQVGLNREDIDFE